MKRADNHLKHRIENHFNVCFRVFGLRLSGIDATVLRRSGDFPALAENAPNRPLTILAVLGRRR